MSRTTVTFNGVNISNLYVVSGWHTPLLGRNFDVVDISGMDGQRFLGATLAPRTITLSLTVKGVTLAEREAAARTLAAALAVDEPKPLTASFMGGRYYLAIPKSDADLHRYVNADTFDVDFYVPDPVSYGDLVTVNISSIVSASSYFEVGGTYPTLPKLVISASRTNVNDPSYFGFSLARRESGLTSVLTYTYIDLKAVMGTSYSGTITVDSGVRKYTSGSSTGVKPLPLVSDWPLLMPGTMRYVSEAATSNCSGSIVMTYRERWL